MNFSKKLLVQLLTRIDSLISFERRRQSPLNVSWTICQKCRYPSNDGNLVMGGCLRVTEKMEKILHYQMPLSNVRTCAVRF